MRLFGEGSEGEFDYDDEDSEGDEENYEVSE